MTAGPLEIRRNELSKFANGHRAQQEQETTNRHSDETGLQIDCIEGRLEVARDKDRLVNNLTAKIGWNYHQGPNDRISSGSDCDTCESVPRLTNSASGTVALRVIV